LRNDRSRVRRVILESSNRRDSRRKVRRLRMKAYMELKNSVVCHDLEVSGFSPSGDMLTVIAASSRGPFQTGKPLCCIVALCMQQTQAFVGLKCQKIEKYGGD